MKHSAVMLMKDVIPYSVAIEAASATTTMQYI